MTVRTEVTRIENNVASAYTVAASKGAALPATQNIANLADTINSISTIYDLSDSICGYKIDLSEVTCEGKCVQAVSPTPQLPQNIICNNGRISVQKNNPLPLGYTQLDYLESTGTQAILTDYQPLGTDTIEVDYNLTNLSRGGDKFIIGSRPSTSAENVGFWVETYGATNTWYVRYGSPSSVNDAYQNSDVSGTFSITKNVFKINGVTRLAPTYEGDPVYPMSIFARRNRDDTVWAGSYIQISNVRVYGSDSVLKHNYVPAKNSSNVLGMYDTVSGTFYTNVGSGDFTYGSTIPRVADTIIASGIQETITDAVGNTSTCEILLGLDNTADVQKIKQGSLEKNIGVCILTGDETWDYTNQGAYGNSSFGSTTAVTDRDYTVREGLCTHFQNTNTASEISQNGKMFLGASTQKINFCNTDITTVEGWKQWLRDQYNAGTPVVVFYPLQNTSTESITPQNQLTTTPFTVAGSLNNLVVEPYKEIVANAIDLTGKFQNIEHIGPGAFNGLFYSNGTDDYGLQFVSGNGLPVTGDLNFTNLKSISVNGSMRGAFAGTNITSASFPMLTTFDDTCNDYYTSTAAPFYDTFCRSKITSLSFGALQTITSNAFRCFGNICEFCTYLTTVSYPLLAVIDSTMRAFSNAFYGSGLVTMSLPSLKVLPNSYYTFEYAWRDCTYLQSISFPSLGVPTNVPGYVGRVTDIGTNTFANAFTGCTNLTEIHFRADVQSRIEAQAGYTSTFGAPNATIYFDL